jgi:hypothetical protein
MPFYIRQVLNREESPYLCHIKSVIMECIQWGPPLDVQIMMMVPTHTRICVIQCPLPALLTILFLLRGVLIVVGPASGIQKKAACSGLEKCCKLKFSPAPRFLLFSYYLIDMCRIVAQIIGSSHNSAGEAGEGRQQYASFTWSDLCAIAPWVDEKITKKIQGIGLGL